MTTSDLNYVRVIDPRLDINSSRNKTYGVLSGAPYQTGRILPSTSFSNSQITFNAPPPSRDIYTNRRFLARVKFRIDFTGTSAGAGIPLLQAFGMNTAPGVSAGNFNYDAPRAMPLSQAMQTVQVTIGNQTFSSNLNVYSRIFQRYHRNEFQEDGDFSYSPSMPDQSQAYSELNGFPRNPLGGYGDNVTQCPRGGFADCIITSNTSTGTPADTASVELTVTEAIPLSPLSFDANQEQLSFIGVDMMTIQLQLGGRGSGLLTGLAQSLWSHSTLGSVLSSATATVEQADLLFNYLTPSSLQYLPDLVTYNYNEFTNYPTRASAPLAPGASTVLAMSSVTLPTIPNRLYIFASPQDSDTNITDTDTFCRISNINLTFANQDGILSNYSPQMLYDMSLKNGLNYSWTQWQQKVGSVVCAEYGTDVPLKDSWAPGVRTSQTLQMLVTITNIHPTKTFTPTLNILSVQEGIVTIDKGSVSKNIGVLDEKQVLDSWDSTPIPQKRSVNIFGASLGGGSFFSDVGTFFKRLVRPGINVAKALAPSQFQPVVSAVSDVASSYGLGFRDVAKRRGAALLM